MASTSGRSSPPERRRRSSRPAEAPAAAGEPGVVVRADAALAQEIVASIERGEVDRVKKFEKGLKGQNSSLLEAVTAASPPLVVASLLHMAASQGFVEMCRYLIKDLKLDVNGTGKFGATPLIAAVDGIVSASSAHKKREYQRVVELLIRWGASTNISRPDGFTPLHAATLRDCYPIAKLLLDNGADVNALCENGSVLHIAANNGTSSEVTKLLLGHGADPNISNISGFSALHLAVMKDARSTVLLLLEKKADVNAVCERGTALLICAEIGSSLAMAELLLNKGADPNITNSSGLNALHLAVQRDSYDIAELLLDKGAEVDTACEKGSSLHMAAGLGHLKMLSLLLQGGASANLYDKIHQKPIEAAARNGHRDCVEKLFPHTDAINEYTDWSIDGIMVDAKNRS